MDQEWLGLMDIIAYGSKQEIIQNLKDAGCDFDTIACCMQSIENGQKNELLKRLDIHRNHLLHHVHEKERQIDCLDYLVFQIDRCKHNK